MYIHYETHRPAPAPRCRQGVFCAACDTLRADNFVRDSCQTDELLRVLSWFDQHHCASERLMYRPGRRGGISGVCWFRDSAGRRITQARYMAWLPGPPAATVCERRAVGPGRILWQDPCQIVAGPQLA